MPERKIWCRWLSQCRCLCGELILLPQIRTRPPSQQAGRFGPMTPAGRTTNLPSSSHAGAHFAILFLKAPVRMADQRAVEMARANRASRSGDLVRSLYLSRRPNRSPSSPRPSTPASRPTRATCVRLFGCSTTRSPCRPTPLRPSSAQCERAQDSTFPPSSLLLQQLPVPRACLRPSRLNLQPAVSYAPTVLKSPLQCCPL